MVFQEDLVIQSTSYKALWSKACTFRTWDRNPHSKVSLFTKYEDWSLTWIYCTGHQRMHLKLLNMIWLISINGIYRLPIKWWFPSVDIKQVLSQDWACFLCLQHLWTQIQCLHLLTSGIGHHNILFHSEFLKALTGPYKEHH